MYCLLQSLKSLYPIASDQCFSFWYILKLIKYAYLYVITNKGTYLFVLH